MGKGPDYTEFYYLDVSNLNTGVCPLYRIEPSKHIEKEIEEGNPNSICVNCDGYDFNCSYNPSNN